MVKKTGDDVIANGVGVWVQHLNFGASTATGWAGTPTRQIAAKNPRRTCHTIVLRVDSPLPDNNVISSYAPNVSKNNYL